MEAWAINGWFKEAIFNLKLPMKSRYKEVSTILENMQAILKENGITEFKLACKHLYHDRDEVTVHLWLRPNSLGELGKVRTSPMCALRRLMGWMQGVVRSKWP